MIPTRFLGHLPPSAAVKRNLAEGQGRAVQRSGIQDPRFDARPTRRELHRQRRLVRHDRAEDPGRTSRRSASTVDARREPVTTFLADYAAGKHADQASRTGARTIPDPNDYLVFTPGGLAANDASTGARATGRRSPPWRKRAEPTMNDAASRGALPARSSADHEPAGAVLPAVPAGAGDRRRAATSRTPPSTPSGRSTSAAVGSTGNTAAMRARAPALAGALAVPPVPRAAPRGARPPRCSASR